MNGLLKNCKVSYLLPSINVTVAGTTGTSSPSYLDMAGYDGCLLIGVPSSGAWTAAAIQTIRAYTGATVATLAATTSYSAGTTSATTAMAEQVVVLDIVKPTARYLSADVYKNGAGAMGIVAIQYNVSKLPVAQSTAQYYTFNSTTIVGTT